MKTETREAYYTDLSKQQNRLVFPIDFADWLRTRDRDEDARKFMARVNQAAKKATITGQNYSVNRAVRIAQDFAQVVDTSRIEDPHQEALNILSAVGLGGDTDHDRGRWDREEAMMRQMEADAPVKPRDLNEPECPEVEIIYFPDDSLLDLAARALVQMTVEGFGRNAKQFAQDVVFALRLPDEAEHLFTLIWSYVTVVPEVDLWVDEVA